MITVMVAGSFLSFRLHRDHLGLGIVLTGFETNASSLMGVVSG